jgi:hypothetical protein
MITSGAKLKKMNLKRLMVNLKLAQSCLYSITSRQSPLKSTSPSKYMLWKVSMGILFLPLYLSLSASFLNVR